MAEVTVSNFIDGSTLDNDTSLLGDVVNLRSLFLDGAHDDSTTTIATTLTISGINAPVYLLIDAEIIHATGISGTDFTGCTRGADGTLAMAHADVTNVYMSYAANAFNQLKRAIIATQTEVNDKVNGPSSAVDNAIVRFDGTTGKISQGYTSNSPTISDTGDMDIDGDLDVENIIVSGNVDGRDVSVDGTKLDGIEASADVTDEANVTDALDGATLTDVGTPASGDKILLQDASDSDIIKTADFSEFGGGGGLSPDEYWGGNLIRNYPSLELANGAAPEWWATTSGTLTEEDSTGEGIPQKHERILKFSATSGNYTYQDFDAADEPTLDNNVSKVSAGCWVYTTTAGTITLELYDVDGTTSLGTAATTTTSSWVWLEVLDATYQDSMRWRVSHSTTATLYLAMPSLNIGATVLPWRERGTREVEEYYEYLVNSNSPSVSWHDLDVSAMVSPLTCWIRVSALVIAGSDDASFLLMRRDGDTGESRAYRIAGIRGANNVMYSQAHGHSFCSDSQLVEWKPVLTGQIIQIHLVAYREWA